MATEGLAAAFTPGGLANQLAFLLIVVAVLTSRMDRARLFLLIAGVVGFSQSLVVGRPVAAFWWALVALASGLMLARVLLESAQCRFTPEEEKMLKGPLSRMPRSRARHFLDQGFWLTGRLGDVLTREEEAVSHLFYLSEGEAKVISNGRHVGTCRPGDLIGEVTVLTGDQASATVVLDGPARFWCAPANVLRPYVQTHEDVRRALEQGFTASMRAKLKASNERAAEPTTGVARA